MWNVECTGKFFYIGTEMQQDELDQTILLFKEKEQQVIKNMINNLQIDDPMTMHLTNRIAATFYLSKNLEYRILYLVRSRIYSQINSSFRRRRYKKQNKKESI